MTPLIRVPVEAIEASLEAMQRVGASAREVALFWLGDIDTFDVTTVVLPVGPGVQWEPLSLRLGEAWMLRLAELCDELGVVVLGAVHSHPVAARMSGIDRDAFFHGPDCVSIVIPDYGWTSIEDAAMSWAVFIGLPRNGWRPGSWGDEVEIIVGDVNVVELRSRDAQGT